MKKVGKVLIVLILLLAIVGGALAYAYFYTDLFKSNKEMFFTYIAQNSEIKSIFNEEAIKALSEKQMNTPYTIVGTFDMDYEQNQELDDLSIDVNGKIDAKNQKYDYDLELNYNQEVSMPYTIKLENDTLAITSAEIVSQFIGLKNENLNEFVQKFGVDAEGIPDKITTEGIDFSKYYLTENEKLNTAYNELITNKFMEESFSKSTADGNTVYTLTTSTEEVKNVFISILEAARNETLVMNKIVQFVKDFAKEEITVEDIQNSMDEYIADLKNETIEEAKEVKINLYVANKDLLKTELLVEDAKVILGINEKKAEINIESLKDQETANIALEKVREDNKIQYLVTYSFSESGLEIGKGTVTYGITGVDTLSNVQTNFDYTIDTLDYASTEYQSYNALLSSKEQYEYYMELDKEQTSDEEDYYDYGEIAEQYKVTDEEINTAREALKGANRVSYGAKVASTMQFDSNLVIEEINENNLIVLNDYDSTQIMSILSQVGDQFTKVHGDKMKELGYEEDPFLQLIPGYSLIKLYLTMSSTGLTTDIMTDGDDYTSSDFDSTIDSDTSFDYDTDEVTNQMDEYPTIVGGENI